jgi:hypothetical protein
MLAQLERKQPCRASTTGADALTRAISTLALMTGTRARATGLTPA